MADSINNIAQILVIVLGLALLAIGIYSFVKKDKLKCKKTLQVIIFIINFFIVVSGFAIWRCSVIIEKRNEEIIQDLETNIEKLKPRLKILDISPSNIKNWLGHLTIKVGSEANQKIDRFTFEVEFESDYDEAKYNYSWDLPSNKGVKYFEPKVIAKKSNKFYYTSEDALPPGFIVHYIFTSERPLIIKKTELWP